MILSGVHILGRKGLRDIIIRDGRISLIAPSGKAGAPGASAPQSPQPPEAFAGPVLHLTGTLAFAGLINSHDHLDFNLFDHLAGRIYHNYREWGTDIHQTDGHRIAKVLRVPQSLRVRWGLYKNLLAGVTTVVHHGRPVPTTQDLISVSQHIQSFHSGSGEKGWKLKILTHRGPIAVHVGEGTDPSAHREIDELLRWNIWRRPLIGIHGVAMDKRQAQAFEALVWCPDSNHFLLNATARVDLLKDKTKMLFGTDSTLSASWNIWDHLRLARLEGMLSDVELLDALTFTPSSVWNLKDRGRIEEGALADVVIARPPLEANRALSYPWDAFFSLNPSDIMLVTHQGEIRLFDEALKEQLNVGGFTAVRYPETGAIKYVKGDLPGLMKQIREYHPCAEFPVSLPE